MTNNSMNNNTTTNNNKTEGKKMIIAGNVNAKEILKAAGKNTFRFINYTLGIDFQNPVIMHKGSGNFTIKKIWDVIPHKNYDYDVAVIVPSTFGMNGYRIVSITEKDFDIFRFYEMAIFFEYRTIPDTYNIKSPFQDDRKKAGHYYVIAQRKDYHKKATKHRSDFGRYNFNNYDRYIITEKTHKYAGNNVLYFKDIQKQGKEQYFSTGSIYYHKPDSDERPVNWFDKSGYYVRDRKNDLKLRAKNIRMEREKARYIETDTSEQSKAVRESIVTVKNALIKKLENVTTYTATKAVTSLLYWNFESVLFDTELFIKRTAGKEYSSIESSNKAYNSIIEKINKIYTEMNKIKGVHENDFI